MSVDQVKKILSDLDPNKSCGPESIHPKILYELHQKLALPLYMMFSKSLFEMTIPIQWKEDKVVAIYKKGDKKMAVNYRPISLPSVVCKLLEKFVRNHIMNHMLDKELICCTQFGFVDRRSTALQLLNVLHK